MVEYTQSPATNLGREVWFRTAAEAWPDLQQMTTTPRPTVHPWDYGEIRAGVIIAVARPSRLYIVEQLSRRR